MGQPDGSVQYLVLSGVGPDRPGLVDLVSKFLLDRGANIEDSRMAVLGGDFAVILLVSGTAEAVDAVARDLDPLKTDTGLTLTVRPTHAPGPPPRGERVPYRVEGTALDHPGIVHRVSHLLAQQGINIESLDTTAFHAPISGSPMFHLKLVISVPADLAGTELRHALADIADAEGIDLEIHPVTPQ